jgi:predicted hotdog family 3-hydroxylacyl-ACP dehydratase
LKSVPFHAGEEYLSGTVQEEKIPMDIETLIPHRGRMRLIDRVLDLNDEESVTSTQVSDLWPLHRDAFVDPLILIEVVAQTAAVHISSRMKSGKTADRRGWMVGIKNADFFWDRIPVDTLLTTTVKNMYNLENYSVLEGEVKAGSDLLCRVQIQVMRASDEETTG